MSNEPTSSQHESSGGFDIAAIQRVLEGVARDCYVEDAAAARDIAFHMTDWAEDLRAIVNLYADPDAYSPEAAKGIVTGFLVHVPHHVAAATKLLTGDPVTDVFGVGAVKEKES